MTPNMTDNLSFKELVAEIGRTLRSATGSASDDLHSNDALGAAGGIRQKLLRDSLNYFLCKVVPGFTGLLSVLVFVRLMGYEEYGHYAVVFAVIMATASGMGGWIAQGILRFRSQQIEPGSGPVFDRATLWGAGLSICVGGLGMLVAIRFTGVQRGWQLGVSFLLSAILLVYTVRIARLQALLRSSGVLRLEIGRALGTFGIPLVLFWLTGAKHYWLLLLGIAIGYLLPALTSFWKKTDRSDWLARRTRRLGGDEKRILRQVWSYGWPVALWLLCQQGLVVSDRYFIQRFLGYSAAGVYSSMYDTIVRSFSLIFMPITLAVHPLVMNRWNAGRHRHALAAIQAGLRYQVLLFVPILAVLALLAPRISHIVLGASYPAAASVVVPLAVAGFLWQLALLAHKPLEILCQTKRMLLGIVAALAVNVGGNWVLVPRLGYPVAAYLAVASAIVYLLVLVAVTPLAELRRKMTDGGQEAPALLPAEPASVWKASFDD
jgi:O-antigen/teichoic acid export membrane protein